MNIKNDIKNKILSLTSHLLSKYHLHGLYDFIVYVYLNVIYTDKPKDKILIIERKDLFVDIPKLSFFDYKNVKRKNEYVKFSKKGGRICRSFILHSNYNKKIYAEYMKEKATYGGQNHV